MQSFKVKPMTVTITMENGHVGFIGADKKTTHCIVANNDSQNLLDALELYLYENYKE